MGGFVLTSSFLDSLDDIVIGCSSDGRDSGICDDSCDYSIYGLEMGVLDSDIYICGLFRAGALYIEALFRL